MEYFKFYNIKNGLTFYYAITPIKIISICPDIKTPSIICYINNFIEENINHYEKITKETFEHNFNIALVNSINFKKELKNK